MREYYIAIDLKSFYASVECIERGLDPLTTNLVVADKSRTDKTICLAVSPSLKSYGVPGRPRLFEVVAKIKEVNARRRWGAPGKKFIGATYDNRLLLENVGFSVDYLVAPPRMALYIDYSTRIYQIYLKYFSPDDIHVYSIDEVFIDVTHYLKTYKKTARELAEIVLKDVLSATGITATVGIGSNMYLAKVAMDIVAKRMKPDEHGARIAELDEMSYRRILWEHRPLTDFWRVGRGYSKKLEAHGIFTMGDVALTSVKNEDLLYKLFGINAELLIDHAWGREPTTIADIKNYKSKSKSLSSSQVLMRDYNSREGEVIVKEMMDQLCLDMAAKKLVTDSISLYVGYSHTQGVPGVGGTAQFSGPVNTAAEIVPAIATLYRRIVNPSYAIRRIGLTSNSVTEDLGALQLNMFEDTTKQLRHKALQEAMLGIRAKYGKNAILKGMNFEEAATGRERNNQIGGHKSNG